MKSSTIAAAAVMIGFVSVLVYHVSASDALGLGQLPMPAKSVDVAAGTALPLAVEFIVQQCDIGLPDGLQQAMPAEEPVRVSAASPAITDQFVDAEGVPEFVLEEDLVTGQAATVMLSPSIVYIR